MDKIIQRGFDGSPVNHAREMPDGRRNRGLREFHRDDLLPFEGWVAGMSVSQFEPENDKDPVCLYDRWGRILYQWPDEYVPGREEVREKVIEILRAEGRNV